MKLEQTLHTLDALILCNQKLIRYDSIEDGASFSHRHSRNAKRVCWAFRSLCFAQTFHRRTEGHQTTRTSTEECHTEDQVTEVFAFVHPLERTIWRTSLHGLVNKSKINVNVVCFNPIGRIALWVSRRFHWSLWGMQRTSHPSWIDLATKARKKR